MSILQHFNPPDVEQNSKAIQVAHVLDFEQRLYGRKPVWKAHSERVFLHYV